MTNTKEGLKQVHAVLDGIVQGVGMRYFVTRVARRFGLGGFVRNLLDGTVEVVLEGREDILLEALREIRQGPPHADVRDMRVTWKEPFESRFSNFDVRF
ncbi:MAG: acylphosphatase [Armatimonadetes bacterium]|nr:acylphosphatase [Armatimonadota bacterium]